MIVCVGPNPSLDRTLVLGALAVGAVHRAGRVEARAGGKAANVARTVDALGADVVLTGPLGGGTGDEVRRLADAEGLTCRWTAVAEPTRVCVVLVADDGSSTVINEPGTVDGPGWADVLGTVARVAEDADVVLVSGSLPRVGSRQPIDDVLAAVPARVPLWLDTSGDALRRALAAARPPDLVKVNLDEAAAAVGRRPTGGDAREGPDGVVRSGREVAVALAERLAAPVVVTLGAHGALHVGADGRAHGRLAVDGVVDPTGSGDSFLAGLAVATVVRRTDVAGALALALACGASNARRLAGGAIDPAEVEAFAGRAEIVAW